ncbi:Mitochondrial adenine nucleotide transporter ADNT1 [Camellia lanceoleosa]|nr:Mitochondrial adenine nucleotide transporter ADNT1 [Camellia lanceoleosa]
MASEDVVPKMSETMVLTIVYLAEEAKIARERVKALSHALLSICKSFIAGGVAEGVSPQCSQTCISISVSIPSLSLLSLRHPHPFVHNDESLTIFSLPFLFLPPNPSTDACKKHKKPINNLSSFSSSSLPSRWRPPIPYPSLATDQPSLIFLLFLSLILLILK